MKNQTSFQKGSDSRRGSFKKGHKTNVGKIRSEETKRKIGLAHKGKKLTCQQIVKLKIALKGRKAPKSAFRVGDERTCGSANVNWKGGITPINEQIRHSSEYKVWRSKVFTRDNFTCVCGLVGGKLEAHHIKSFSQFPELRFEVDNGVTLCVECHKLTDNYKRKALLTN